MWAITSFAGSTPAAVSASSATRPDFAAALVCTITGAPVSVWAAATAATMRGTSPTRPCSSTANLMNPAFTPESAIPSVSSRTKMAASASAVR